MDRYHLIGLGGIGMSALARVLIQSGVRVQGSDVNDSPLLDCLKKEGVSVQIGHRGDAVTSRSTVVYSSDIPLDNEEIVQAKLLQLPILHRSDLLHQLMQGKKPLLVTGTHGKTTTTALLVSVLFEAGLDPSFVIGGIHQKWKTNGRYGQGSYFVAEADESDGSFLKTSALSAIVTNLEDEHLNFWKTSEALDQAFGQFMEQTEHLIWCGDDARLKVLQPKGISYGFEEHNHLIIQSLKETPSGICFGLLYNGKYYSDIALPLFGRHNALNATAVFGLALHLGISVDRIRKAFATFEGTERRLEWKGTVHSLELYDDYGHHPTEIAATLQALRGKIREKRLVVVFQPHRFTRVRDLFDSFLSCFSEADLVCMTDIYSAGEIAIDGVSSLSLYTKLREKLGTKVYFFPRIHLELGVANLLQLHDVVLTIGAGDVTKSGKIILDAYREKSKTMAVGVLFGGTSSEHAVSLMSAQTILNALDPTIYQVKQFGLSKNGEWVSGSDSLEQLEQKISFPPGTPKISARIMQELTLCDVVIPVFHGQQGEDGMIQGLLDALNIAYVGCDYRSSALCMHKGWTKHVACMAGIPTPYYKEIDKETFRKNPNQMLELVEEYFQYPVWIKAVHLGSSIGVVRVSSKEELFLAAKYVFSLDDTLLIEQEIEGREIEISILGNEVIRVGLPAEIVKDHIFHTYETKYGDKAFRIEIPAALSEVERAIVEELAVVMYKKTNCKGLARIDFFLDKNGHFWFNEINPFPGCTKTSAYPKAWEKAGLSMRQLCDEWIILGLHRHRRLNETRGR